MAFYWEEHLHIQLYWELLRRYLPSTSEPRCLCTRRQCTVNLRFLWIIHLFLSFSAWTVVILSLFYTFLIFLEYTLSSARTLVSGLCSTESWSSVLLPSAKKIRSTLFSKVDANLNMIPVISFHLHFLSVSSPTSAITVNKSGRECGNLGASRFLTTHHSGRGRTWMWM